ncbi:MAG: phosphatase PAP2 family protein [Burkholderiales bacterium]|nr:phosphatase PAP2 family protein [Burkholderiales bacterium]
MIHEFQINNHKYIKLILLFFILGLIAIFVFDKYLFNIINIYCTPTLISGYNNIKKNTDVYNILTSENLILGISLLFIASAIYRKFSKFKKTMLLFIVYQLVCSIFLIALKLCLKTIFARCSPLFCFSPENLWNTYDFGFRWMAFQSGFLSFPSGHCFITAYSLMLIINMLGSNLTKTICLSGFVILFLSLIVFNFHFLGDCLIGTALGLLWGLISINMWNILIRKFNSIAIC